MSEQKAPEPKLRVRFEVVAYDESGYGDNRSQSFTDGDAAVAYARSLEARFMPSVWKHITMDPINVRIDHTVQEPPHGR